MDWKFEHQDMDLTLHKLNYGERFMLCSADYTQKFVHYYAKTGKPDVINVRDSYHIFLEFSADTDIFDNLSNLHLHLQRLQKLKTFQ